jgi:hypothetical protein
MSPDGGWINYWWRTQREGRYELDFSELNVYSNDFEALLNQLDKRLTRGQLTAWSRNLIKYNISRTLRTYDRVSNAIGLVLFSPEFNILK